MLLYSIVSNILSMAWLVGLAVARCERFYGVSARSVSVAVDLSVTWNVAAGEGASITSGESIKERELLNEELTEKLEIELDQIHGFLVWLYLFYCGVLVAVYVVYDLFFFISLFKSFWRYSLVISLNSWLLFCFNMCLILLIAENIALLKELNSIVDKLATAIVASAIRNTRFLRRVYEIRDLSWNI